MTYPHQPGFKVTRPETSREAAEVAAALAMTLRERVETWLRGHEVTADECAEALGESILSIRPRLSELRALGRIEDTGKRRKNVSGNSAVVWRATVQKPAQEEMVLG